MAGVNLHVSLNPRIIRSFQAVPQPTTTEPTFPQKTNYDGKDRTMATVSICERCNAFGRDNVMGLMTVNYNNQAGRAAKIINPELCASCLAEFDEWMSNPPASRQGSAVTQQYTQPQDDSETRRMARIVAEEYLAAQQRAQQPALPAPTAVQDITTLMAVSSAEDEDRRNGDA